MKTLLLLIVMACACEAQPAPKISVAAWPGGRAAAISLTFDDAMTTHLDNAGPILKRHGLRGTFFVSTGGKVWKERASEWRRLASEGNEIADHTVTHPCLLERIKPRSQGYTPEMMERELGDSSKSILALTGCRRGLTFAYPCGNLTFGPPGEQARNSALFLRYITDHCFAARGYGAGGAAQDPDALSVMNVTDLGITAGRSYAQMLSMADPALQAGTWGVFAFHGVGGEWLSVPAQDFDELAAWLERHSDTVWTATFGDAVRYIQERKALGIQAAGSGRRTEVTLTWPLDPQIYDLPLTLKVDLAPGAGAPNIEADAKAVTAKVVKSAALFDIARGTKKVVIQ